MATLNSRSGFPARDVCNEQICGILVYSSSTLVAYIVLSVILVIDLFYTCRAIAVSNFRGRDAFEKNVQVSWTHTKKRLPFL